MRVFSCFLLAAGLAAGDVVVLKDGSRIPGRVVEKPTHVEVATPDMGLRTFLKEEVEKILKDPKELLGDSDRLFEDAKKDFEKILAAPAAEQNALVREAVAKVTRVREAYATALDLFPDDDKLAKQLMLVMQLMRLLRDRMGSEIAKRPDAPPSSPNAPAPPPPPLPSGEDAWSVLRDPAKRGDPARRQAARAAFQARRDDLSRAAALFLSKTDPEMGLAGPALKAAQDYLEATFKDPAALTPEKHLDALKRLSEARKAGPLDALQPLALAHAANAAPAAEAEKAARALGLAVVNGRVGTPEGHAVADLNGWIASGDYDLAVLAFVREHRAVDTPIVRYVWSYALLRLVTAKKRGFERPVDALGKISTSDAGFREHLAALGKSIKAAGSCGTCLGEGKVRCVNCHGKKQIIIVCAKCKGKGKTLSSLGAELVCGPCKATGNSAAIICRECKDGYFDCKQCPAPKPPPALEDMVGATSCGECDATGLALSKARLPCRACAGLGLKLVPKADPSKVLK
jgi:hypothetical protein